MGQQILLKVLIVCLTLSQGFASLSYNISGDKFDLLVRKKRVIDRTPNSNTRVRLRDVSYVVYVQENGGHACAGTILSQQVILVPCSCVTNFAIYTIISGTTGTRGGKSHTVTGILRHPNCSPHSHRFNIALLEINEPIAFAHNLNEPITIFHSNDGQLRPNTQVTVSGYGLAIKHSNFVFLGSTNGGPQRQIMPNELRSIHLPIISTHDCATFHDNDPDITPQHVICTFHENKFCGPGDSGSPLVYQHTLFGILSYDGVHGRPDIFVNVAVPAQRNWIYGNMDNITRYVGPAAQQGHRTWRPFFYPRKVHPINR